MVAVSTTSSGVRQMSAAARLPLDSHLNAYHASKDFMDVYSGDLTGRPDLIECDIRVLARHMTTIDMNITCQMKSLRMLLPTYPFQRKNHLPTHPMALLRTRQLNLQPSSTAA